MSRMTFINLPVKDLAKARAFFGSIGFSFDEEFTDENASRMIVSDDTSVMLAVEPFFKGFISPLEVADTSKSRETIVGLSAESREEVDDLVGKAVSGSGYARAGGDDMIPPGAAIQRREPRRKPR